MEKIVWATDGDFEYVSLTKETLEGGLNVMKHAFFKDESVCLGVELNKEPGADDELLELCMRAARDGLSIVAVDTKTGKVSGASFNKLQVKPKPGEQCYFENYAAGCKFASSKALVEFMIDVDAICDIFEVNNTDTLLELMFTATLPEYRRKGIALKLMEVSIQLAKSLHEGKMVKVPVEDNTILTLEPVPKVVSAIFTCIATQRIGQKLGFTKHVEKSFEEYSYKGKSFASRIDNGTLFTTVESLKL